MRKVKVTSGTSIGEYLGVSILMDIEGLLRKHNIYFRASGDRLRVLCPFHKETVPSLHISRSMGVWYCFGCGRGGKIDTFFSRLGIHDIGSLDIDEQRVKKNIKKTTYLPESILAPYKGKIPKYLLDLGYDINLLRRKEVGFDEERDRIIFPIRDRTGALTGISGRAVYDWMTPKYKYYISEVSDIVDGYTFERNKQLYNVDCACKSTDNFLYIVEGFKACLHMLNNNFPNTVALLGSRLSQDQQNIIITLADIFYLFLDNDPSGIRGMLQAGDALSKFGIVYVLIGDKKQPDDYDRKELYSLIENKKKFEVWKTEVLKGGDYGSL